MSSHSIPISNGDPGTRVKGPDKSDEQFNTEICQKIVKTHTETIERQESLVQRTKDAKEALALAVETIRKDVVDWVMESNDYLKEIQMWRMAVVNEITQANRSIGDAKDTLLSPESQNALAKLHEFVGLCERIKKLKEDGTFDVLLAAFLAVHEHREQAAK